MPIRIALRAAVSMWGWSFSEHLESWDIGYRNLGCFEELKQSFERAKGRSHCVYTDTTIYFACRLGQLVEVDHGVFFEHFEIVREIGIRDETRRSSDNPVKMVGTDLDASRTIDLL